MRNAQHTGDHCRHIGCGRATAASDENTNWLTVSLFGCRDSTLDIDFGHEDYSFSCWRGNSARCVLHAPPLEARTVNVANFFATREHRGGNLVED
jgi:hypothetical protein